MVELKCKKYELLDYEVYMIYEGISVEIYARPSGFVEDHLNLVFLCAVHKDFEKLYKMSEYDFVKKELEYFLEEKEVC